MFVLSYLNHLTSNLILPQTHWIFKNDLIKMPKIFGFSQSSAKLFRIYVQLVTSHFSDEITKKNQRDTIRLFYDAQCIEIQNKAHNRYRL